MSKKDELIPWLEGGRAEVHRDRESNRSTDTSHSFFVIMDYHYTENLKFNTGKSLTGMPRSLLHKSKASRFPFHLASKAFLKIVSKAGTCATVAV